MRVQEKQTILEELEFLIKEAEEKGWWLRSHYQQLEFSPRELRESNAQGRFIWGPVNWELIDPKTLLKDEEKELHSLRKHNATIEHRMKKK